MRSLVKKILFIIMLLFMINMVQGAEFNFLGSVFRSDNKQPVPYATVLVKHGTNTLQIGLTEDNGTFKFNNIPRGGFNLIVKQAGFYKEEIFVDLQKNQKIAIYLIPSATMTMGEIEVLGEKQRGIVSKSIITKDMRNKATTSITGDPLNVLSKMPGIESTGFNLNTGMGSSSSGGSTTGGGMMIGGLSGVSVRGGDSTENTALLDDVQIPYPFHSFMPDSVFIDALIGDIIVYKGIYSPRYGQAMSSLLDVAMDKPATGFHGKINIALLNVYATVNGASTNGKWSYLGGIKRTSYDIVVPLFFTFPAGSEINIPYYIDSHGAVRYKTKTDNLSFLWQVSGEPGKIKYTASTNGTPINATMDTWHAVVNTTWKHKFTSSLGLEQALDYSFTGNYKNIEFNNSLMKNISTEKYFRYKIFGDISPVKNISFKIGGEELYYPSLFYTNFSRMIQSNKSTMKLETNSMMGRYRGSYGISTGFLDSDITFFDQFHFAGGLRVSYADLISKWSYNPRTTLEYFIKDKNKIYLAWGYQSQFPSDPATVARLTTNYGQIQVPTVQQGVLGTEFKITPTIGVIAEGYVKKYKNLLATMSNIQQELDTAGYDRDIYGIDILLQKAADTFPFYGWIGFSRFTSWDKYTHGFFTTSNENLRNAYPPVGVWHEGDSTDYKVDVTTVYQITKKWSLTIEFNWHSGSAYTPVVGSKKVTVGSNQTTYPVYGSYKSARYEDGHQLNLKMEWKGRKWGHLGGFFIQLNNVYNHKPVTSIRWNADYTEKVEGRSFFGIYPNLGFWWEF